MIDIGTRIRVVDWAEENFGLYGTVTRAEHPAFLTGRPMVEVRIDGRKWMYDVGLYVEQIEALPALRVVA